MRCSELEQGELVKPRPRSPALVAVIAFGILVALSFTAGAGWLGYKIWWRQQWVNLQKQQIATINKLALTPPPGWSVPAWENTLVTPANVWGNVVYTPEYCGLDLQDMQMLQADLDMIVSQATRENAFQQVDAVFALLLGLGKRQRFITGYREEFSEFADRQQ